jgi:hypothetical protein
MRESLYDMATSRKDKINNLGFDYKGKILRKTLSSYLFADPTRAAILDEFEKWLYFLVEKVKLIKTYYNYTVPKNYRKIN